METHTLTLKNKSHLDCWGYVGAIEVYYLCAGYRISLQIPRNERVYVVSSKQNVKHLVLNSQEMQFFEIFF